MAVYPGFVGNTDRVSARTVNAERTINWYLERATGTPKAPQWLVPTPGLDPFVVLGAGPVRALFAEEGRCFAVGGGHFYEILGSQTFLHHGAVGTDGRPASISSNGSDGHQLLIISAGAGFIFDLNDDLFTPIIDDGFPVPVSMGTFIDGYFLALKGQSDTFQLSELENGLVWDALDVAQVSHTTGIVRAMVALHRELWLLGSSRTTVWADVGQFDPDFPFAPIPGALIEQGIGSLFGWVIVANQLYWHGQNEDGARVAVRANGYQIERVSTHAVEHAWADLATMQDTVCWGYQDRGHAFACWYIPGAETTWVYDVTTNAWHERALWDPTALVWTPHLARCHAFAFDRHLVGDRSSPAVYHLDPHTHLDGRVVLG